MFFRFSFREDKRHELFEYIWTQYGRRISYYIANIIPFTHPAFEDVFQEVMMKIYGGLSQFNPKRSFKAWIYTIARNHCLDFLKNRRERIFAGHTDSAEDLPGSDDPERRVMYGEALTRIDTYLDSLDSSNRQIAFLRFFENLSYKEIGRILEKHPGTLRARVHHLKRELAEQLRGFL